MLLIYRFALFFMNYILMLCGCSFVKPAGFLFEYAAIMMMWMLSWPLGQHNLVRMQLDLNMQGLLQLRSV
jgi:hypothetical protein